MSNKRKLLTLATLGILTLPQSAHSSENSTFTYDALGRLVATANSGGPRDGRTNSTQYDPGGNRKGHASGQPLPSASNAAVFSITGPASIIEGEVAVFTVSKTGSASSTLTVNVASINGTATAPGDFAAVATTLSFLPWETSKTVPISLVDDGIGDEPEQFSVALSNPSAGASISTASFTTVISGAQNQPPVPGIDAAHTEVCTSVQVNVLANDTDPEGNYPLTVVSATAPTFGSMYWVNATTFSFTASSPGGGTATYVVRDSLGATATGQIHVSTYGGPCP